MPHRPSVRTPLTSVILTGLVVAPLWAQGSVTGTVRDSVSGEPLTGVTVQIQGTTLGGLTSDSGRYTIRNVPAGSRIVSARRLGYVARRRDGVQVPSSGSVTVDFALARSVFQLQEMVVTGVVDPIAGVKAPFSVGRVSAEDISTVPTTNSAAAAIQGKVAGVTVIRSSGQPGTGVSVLLRTPTSIQKDNGPMYVVDGVILGSTFSGTTVDLESLDIESVEVVKGAAAASLYGSRAASGVISITTRRGKSLPMGRTQIGVRSEYGFSAAPTNVRVTRHHQFLTDAQGRFIDTLGRVVTTSSARVVAPDRIMDNAYGVPVYDNIETFFRPGRFTTNQLNFGQNTEKTNFFASVNQYQESGSLENNNGFIRRNFRINLDHRPTGSFEVRMSAFHGRSSQDELSGDPFFGLLTYPPDVDLGKRDSLGTYLQQPDPTVNLENPLWRQASRDNYERRVRTLASLDATYSPFSWLTLASNMSYDRSDLAFQVYIPRGTPLSLTADVPSDGALEREAEDTDELNGSVSATLLRNFAALTSRLTFRGVMEREKNEFLGSYGYNLRVLGVPDLNMAADDSVVSAYEEIRTNAYMAQLGLDYAEKYVADLLYRRDGSSLFGPDARWNDYYRIAGAYRMAREPWWPIPQLSEFKLRYSIGTAGGRPEFEDQFETFNVIGATGRILKGTLGNRELKPELTTEHEMGIDLIAFNKYSLELSYIRQKTEDQIVQLPVPGPIGYSAQWANTGTQEGHTFEATFQAALIDRADLSWKATVVADRSRSKITEWNRACFFDELQNICEGAGLGEMWGETFIRSLDQLPARHAGSRNQFQLNDDGFVVPIGATGSWQDGRWGTNVTIDGRTYQWGIPLLLEDAAGFEAIVPIGRSEPDLNLGWLNNVRWKGLNVHSHVHAQIGGDVYNATRQRMYQHMRHADLDQSGKPPQLRKSIDYYSKIYNQNDNTSHFVEDGSYVKLRELSVQYRFNQGQLERLGLRRFAPEGLSIGIIGRNLFTITDYKGFDPDVGTALERRDNFTYPPTRTFTGIVEVSF